MEKKFQPCVIYVDERKSKNVVNMTAPNMERINRALQEYYRTATPEQVVAEFEALGVVFEDIPNKINKNPLPNKITN